jgi:signal transduction histidine kinase
MEALGKLTGGIAHDFNNLLALILGNAEVIVGHNPPDTVTGQAAGDIVEAALAGSALVRRMLDFSRGHRRQPQRISVNRVVGDVIALITRSIPEAIAVRGDLSPAAGEVEVDATVLETALINLALNARDAMQEGGVLTFRTARRPGALEGHSSAVAVSVSDNGSGMDDETARRAFEPYYTTKGPERGTGLGLAMVYSFAEQSGGRATLASEPGRGTTVELLLPPAKKVPAEN